MTPRDAAKLVGGLVLAVLLMWWVLRDTEPSALWAQLRQASIPGLLFGASLNIVALVFRAWRWRALLAPCRADVAFLGVLLDPVTAAGALLDIARRSTLIRRTRANDRTTRARVRAVTRLRAILHVIPTAWRD